MVKSLLSTRKYLKGRITLVENELGDIHAITDISQLDTSLHFLNDIIEKFETCQIQLEAEGEDYEAEGLQISRKYYDLVQRINSAKAKLTTVKPPPSSIESTEIDNEASYAKLSLPKISLPTFSSEYTKWLNFKDLYVSLVHENKTLSDIQKFYYLKTCLKGSALQLISSLECTNANYQKAWTTLVERFDNKYLIAVSHIKGIFGLSKVSKNSASSLRTLLNEFSQHHDCLEALNIPNLNDFILVYILSEKLDFETMRDFDQQRGEDEFPTLISLKKHLNIKCRSIETHSRPEMQASQRDVKRALTCVENKKKSNTINKCVYCQYPHPLYKCFKFKNAQLAERKSFINKAQLCTFCLSSKHKLDKCTSPYSGCRRCSQKHHELLHSDESPDTNNQAASVSAVNHSNVNWGEYNCYTARSEQETVLLSTAVINVITPTGDEKPCRILLDSGSEKNFVTSEFLQDLNICSHNSNWQVAGVGCNSFSISKTVNLTLASRVTKHMFQSEFGVIEEITQQLPHTTFDKAILKWPSFIQLADPNFNVSSKIDILLGAEGFYKVLQKGKVDLCNGTLALQNTTFGWVFGGLLKLKDQANKFVCNTTSSRLGSMEELNSNIIKFWQLEDVSENKRALAPAESLCEKLYEASVSRTPTGRYEVDLPVEETKLENLGSSYQHALQCFLSLERKFKKNPSFFERYKKFIDEFISLGHAHEIRYFSNPNELTYYLPHHAVLKEDSSTTKLRVVFNGSAKTNTGSSLNNVLLVGPVVQPTLFAILLRFRTYLYGITADISKMYRMINIKPKYQSLQRILWRDNSNSPIKCLQLSTVTYGTASASYQATRTLLQLVSDEGKSHPLAAYALEHNTYVDDIMTGANDRHSAIALQNQLTLLLRKGEFNLHKWHSNCPEILNLIPADKQEICNFSLPDGTSSMKTLGLLWNPSLDVFQFTVPDEIMHLQPTKRKILSVISKIYDPLGLVSVVVVEAKMLMQAIWKEKLDWDSLIPLHILNDWNLFIKNIILLREVKVPRLIFKSFKVKFQVHGFADSSEKAYGCAIYLRSGDGNNIHTRLICSKSRVAPLKSVSIPRLELCACLLLASLMSTVMRELHIDVDSYYCWTDSTIALSWIKSEAYKWNTFVSNRIAKIQEKTTFSSWNHVPSTDNPADIVSRGLATQLLSKCNLWWNGPDWLLKGDDSWPKLPIDVKTLPEAKRVSHVVSLKPTIEPSYLLQRLNDISKWPKIIRTLSYILRVQQKIKNLALKFPYALSVCELNNAKNCLVSIIQKHYFAKELSVLSQLNENSRIDLGFSKLKYLNPFIDENGIIRVGGRLKYSDLLFSKKHPIIMPADAHITRLLIIYEHERLLHAGAQTTLANLRERFWILNGRNKVRFILRQCIKCFRFMAKPAQQLMADLPAVRVSPARPFTSVGIDFTGAILMKQSRIRKSIVTKGYVCLFICMSVKAIHLELCSDMTTPTFLAALRRFVARRGKCKYIYSDNGSNFKGAKNELRELHKLLNDRESALEIENELSKESIEWKFITPLAPHHGGLWESGIKMVKYHIKRIMGNSLYTYEELNTLIVQIEAIINSRPLHPLSNEPDNLTCLTPSHFLINTNIMSLPEQDFSLKPANRLSLWNQITKLRQLFWKRWSTDYLHSLQQRTKWYNATDNVNVNDLVILKEDNVPPLKWNLARVVELLPGRDGHVRSIVVKTNKGVFTRPITKVCLFPKDS